ncbi:MAG: hypothetical protein D8M58_14750 [Calditrichaeota bacterium]|nr:MAG: hypothetical protein DWQ03_15990 [Calditrichota bacterium]MBL1206662.1 hypothetical protein [Calditrichota bacterium]NOG46489.1 hypothetical protein [Calditrichota bacterium]
MSEKMIFSVLSIVGKLGSALNEESLHAILPEEMKTTDLKSRLNTMESSGKISRLNELIVPHVNPNQFSKNKKLSRDLFKSNKRYLKLFAQIPWVRYMALTGSNAFESCSKNDDIDLFVICAPKRLWIIYLTMTILGKVFNKRPLFCVNYLIDEDNLKLPQQDYYSAVQFYKMKPLFNAGFKQKLLIQNKWIAENLPNASSAFSTEEFYRLRKDFTGKATNSRVWSWLNKKILDFYKKRWTRMYPFQINKNILIDEGLAKLHRIDHSSIYDEIL